MPNHLKIPEGNLAGCLQSIINEGFGQGSFISMYMGLYNSNYTPTNTDTLATYTAIESTFVGYTRQLVAVGNWSTAAQTGQIAYTNNTVIVFTAGILLGSETQYGYFMTDQSGTFLLWAQLFDTPVVISTDGQVLALIPNFTFSSEY
jgi:hypothetical protein